MAEGFGFVAMVRALLRQPDLVNGIKADSSVRSLRNHNNRCMPTNYTGALGVVVDPLLTADDLSRGCMREPGCDPFLSSRNVLAQAVLVDLE